MAASGVSFTASCRWLTAGLIFALLVAVGRLVLATFQEVPESAIHPQPAAHAESAVNKKHQQIGEVIQIAVDPGCQYCEVSFPFYRAIAAARGGGNYRLEALMSVTKEQGAEYLRAHSLKVDDIRQVNFHALGVTGTPTVRLLNNEGQLLQEWIGMMSVADENDLVVRVGVVDDFLVAAHDELRRSAQHVVLATLRTGDVVRLLSAKDSTLIDTRPRSQFAAFHIEGSRNIPLDELMVRAPDELRKNSQIILYCPNPKMCSIDQVGEVSRAECTLAYYKLKSNGFENTSLYAVEPTELKSTDFKFESTERIRIPRVLVAKEF